MGLSTFDTVVVLIVGAFVLVIWRRRNVPPPPLTSRQRERLMAMRSRGRTAYILRTGVLGFGLPVAIVKTIIVYAGFYEWRQPELDPLARFGYWFIRMLPINLAMGAIWGVYMWRHEARQFQVLDDSPLAGGPPQVSGSQTSSPRSG